MYTLSIRFNDSLVYTKNGVTAMQCKTKTKHSILRQHHLNSQYSHGVKGSFGLTIFN